MRGLMGLEYRKIKMELCERTRSYRPNKEGVINSILVCPIQCPGLPLLPYYNHLKVPQFVKEFICS